jgi:tight adherence protein B
MRAALFLALAALAFAAPASAAESLQARGFDASGYPTVRVSVVTPAPSAKAPSMRENGRPVVGFEAENLARAKSIVLAIDRSQSMAGEALADAIAAARSFVASKQPADRISLIAFGRTAVRLTGFAAATIDSDAALAGLGVDRRQGTALYDAIDLGSRALAGSELAGRVLIVLTDGDDVSSRTSLAQAAAQAKRAGVAVYAIGIEGQGFSPTALEQIAHASGGAYLPADSSAGVEAAYASIAAQLRRTWRLTYLTSAAPAERVDLVAVHGGRAAKVTGVMPGDASVGVVPSREASPLLPGFLYRNNIGTVVVALFSGSCAILAMWLVLATPGGTRLRRRLEPHTSGAGRRRDRSAPRERFAAASGMLSATEKSLAHLRFWKALHRLIERADLPLRTVEFFYICVGGGFVFGFFAAVFGAPPLFALVIMAGGFFTPVLFAVMRAKRRLNAIEEQLPDLLITIAASLKAGHSFRQGLQSVVDEGQPPAADEFKRVLTETSLGRSMDDALEEMSQRVGSKNLDFVITAVTIQRQVGGSLASIFDLVADAVRQRQQFARKVKALTGMGRAAAYVLLGLPFFLAITFTLVNPDYMSPLWNTSAGHKIVFTGLVMMAFGSVIIRKMVSFRG